MPTRWRSGGPASWIRPKGTTSPWPPGRRSTSRRRPDPHESERPDDRGHPRQTTINFPPNIPENAKARGYGLRASSMAPRKQKPSPIRPSQNPIVDPSLPKFSAGSGLREATSRTMENNNRPIPTRPNRQLPSVRLRVLPDPATASGAGADCISLEIHIEAEALKVSRSSECPSRSTPNLHLHRARTCGSPCHRLPGVPAALNLALALS